MERKSAHRPALRFCVLCLLLAAVCSLLIFTGCGNDTFSVPDFLTGLLSEETTTVTEQETTTTTTATTTTTTTTRKTTVTTTTTTTTTTVTTTTTTTTVTALTIGELSVVTTLTTASPDPDAHGLTPEYRAFLSDTVFVGDSICSGLRAYHILPDDNCVAVGCVAARNIFEYTFPVRGNDFYLRYALSVLKPKYVVFSMGMNDVNMTDAETYCENYSNLMDTIQEVLPDAKLFAASITPIAGDSTFSSNERIDSFNAALRRSLEDTDYGYVDVNSSLKIWTETPHGLNPAYNGGDGIHLAPYAYDIILKQVCQQLVDTDIVGGVSKEGVPYGSAT